MRFHLSQVLIDLNNEGGLPTGGGKLLGLFEVSDCLYLVAGAPVRGTEGIKVGRCFVVFRDKYLLELCDCVLVLLLIYKNASQFKVSFPRGMKIDQFFELLCGIGKFALLLEDIT